MATHIKLNSAKLESFKRTMHKLSRKLRTLIVQFLLFVGRDLL